MHCTEEITARLYLKWKFKFIKLLPNRVLLTYYCMLAFLYKQLSCMTFICHFLYFNRFMRFYVLSLLVLCRHMGMSRPFLTLHVARTTFGDFWQKQSTIELDAICGNFSFLTCTCIMFMCRYCIAFNTSKVFAMIYKFVFDNNKRLHT